MNKEEVLRNLVLGNSVAEYDSDLANYFVKTAYVNDFLTDNYDIVTGAKGAGKTAMLIALSDNCIDYKELHNVKLIKAINIKGDPDFKRAFDSMGEDLKPQEIVDAWKIYIINVLWNSLIKIVDNYDSLEQYLTKNLIIVKDEGFLSKIVHALKRCKMTVTNKINFDGSVEQGVSLEPSENVGNVEKYKNLLDYNYIFREMNSLLKNNNCRIWVMLDRLDDAFPDNTTQSMLILKNLLVAYKDICIYDNFKLKIFIRDDIFHQITKKGFTSLTHVSAKTMPAITWDKDKLELLLIERLKFNHVFKNYLDEREINYEQLSVENRREILNTVFKPQVDNGDNNPDTVGWIINHIKDGLNQFTPRDFINLIDKARHHQLNDSKEKLEEQEFLIGTAALRKAHQEVSKQKIETQLFAEYPLYRSWIEKFRDEKAEHNEETIKKLLGKQWKSRVEKLVSIGFLEEKKSTWKIPFIYRAGLNVTQGKAFKG